MAERCPFTKNELTQLAEQVKAIVTETGAFLANTCATSVLQKEGHANFVTDMDVKVQDRLVSALTPLLPDASFLLEESDEEQPTLTDLVWIIDPIDGTQNFICQNKLSAISIGLYYRGYGILGVVYNPFLKELFFAVRGLGAYLNDSPIQASGKTLENAVISVGTSPYYEELRPKVIKAITTLYPLCCDFRRFGSAALELCYVACGRCDGFFEYRLSPWDFAGASVILEEAGCRISSIEKDSLDYTKKSSIVAGGESIFADLKKHL